MLDPEDEGTTLVLNVTTHHKTRDDPRKGGRGGFVSGAVRGTAVYSRDKRNATGRSDIAFHYYHRLEKNNQVFCVACSEWLHCENALRIGTSNSSFTAKSGA